MGRVYLETEVRTLVPSYDLMIAECEAHGLAFERSGATVTPGGAIGIAVGWHRLLDREKLIVFHDSLLPRYRGFNPLVTALQNGDTEIGATVLWAADEVDAGDIISQRSAAVRHPIKIADAIDVICDLYVALAADLLASLARGELPGGRAQDHDAASYSVWRDEADMRIDWAADSAAIKRFVDSVGYPYGGASTFLQNRPVRVLDCEVAATNVRIVNRCAGKIFRLDEGHPLVICGSGLLHITQLVDEERRESLLPLRTLKRRFHATRQR